VNAAYNRNDLLDNDMLPVDVVFGPAWWYHHEGITFDEDFFFHPARRVEVERKMENVLHDRWGRFGLGRDHDADLPVIGAIHLAAGFLVSEMLGCRVEYLEDAPPQVIPANLDRLILPDDDALQTAAFKKLEQLADSLETKYGRLLGDVNWSGVLNVGLDLRGQTLLMDMIDRPGEVSRFLGRIAGTVESFTSVLAKMTGTTSISVNRNVCHIPRPVYLHSECSLVMISVDDYERFLMPYDTAWSGKYRPFGIHYCGTDPHRYAAAFARLPHLDFLDVGWPGDVALLRRHLPDTFLNVRYSPVEIVGQTPDEIRRTVRRLVHDSANPYLTGVCCINMDQHVRDEQITAIFEEVQLLREEYAAGREP